MKPNILFIDIETSPNMVFTWRIGNKIRIGHENLVVERKITCIGFKWNHESKVWVYDVETLKSERNLLKAISEQINSADLIVAHNGDNFDLPFINTRLLYYNLPPIKTLSTEDTLQQVRKTFYLNSNKLDYLSQYLGYGKKLKTDFELWRKVYFGDKKALNYMIEYCKKDVVLLEKVYNRIAPYVQQRMNKGLLQHEDKYTCSACGSNKVTKQGTRTIIAQKKQQWKCSDCGKWFQTVLRTY